MISFASQALTIGLYATVGLVVAGTLGIDTKPVIAVAGSAGVALGFALRDFASNLLSGSKRVGTALTSLVSLRLLTCLDCTCFPIGFLLIAQRPFKPGDYVVIMSDKVKVEGTVEAIDSRLVYLREEVTPLPGPGGASPAVIKHILIPTSVVYNSVITLTEKVPAAGPKK